MKSSLCCITSFWLLMKPWYNDICTGGPVTSGSKCFMFGKPMPRIAALASWVSSKLFYAVLLNSELSLTSSSRNWILWMNSGLKNSSTVSTPLISRVSLKPLPG